MQNASGNLVILGFGALLTSTNIGASGTVGGPGIGRPFIRAPKLRVTVLRPSATDSEEQRRNVSVQGRNHEVTYILFYIVLDGRLMAVPIVPKGNALEAGTPVPLFVTSVGGAVQFDRLQYVISPDGQRFLMNTVTEDPSVAPITVILNWKPKP